MNCDKCDKEMTENERDCLGVRLEAIADDIFTMGFLQKQWGKWFDKAAKEEGINVCFECFVDKIMEK